VNAQVASKTSKTRGRAYHTGAKAAQTTESG
jgi:hypothetical protein